MISFMELMFWGVLVQQNYDAVAPPPLFRAPIVNEAEAVGMHFRPAAWLASPWRCDRSGKKKDPKNAAAKEKRGRKEKKKTPETERKIGLRRRQERQGWNVSNTFTTLIAQAFTIPPDKTLSPFLTATVPPSFSASNERSEYSSKWFCGGQRESVR